MKSFGMLIKVVDEYDSVNGCHADHDCQPPYPNKIMDTSPTMWKALEIPQLQIGNYDITLSDAGAIP